MSTAEGANLLTARRFCDTIFYMKDHEDIVALAKKFGIGAEYAGEAFYPAFRSSVRGMRLLLLADENTKIYAKPLAEALAARGQDADLFVIPEREPVADEKTCALVSEKLKGYDHILAVGAGTLNDIAKYTGFLAGKRCGVFATAASMDGFTSGVTPLIKKGFKITENAQTVSEILIDLDVLCAAPRLMTGAGVGDILAKYCCLTDWKMAHLLKGEAYSEGAAALMRGALGKCVENMESIQKCGKEGIDALMRALLISGFAMVIAGSSRPASGAEHHMSHFLEMDFLRRGERIPLHGVKVGLGTLVSLAMYGRIKDIPEDFEGKETVAELAAGLPSPESVAAVLAAFGCPTRFSELGIAKDTMRDMLFNCYKIRDRFTIMTLYHEHDLMKGAADELIGRFY